MKDSTYFTKFDIWWGYNNIWIWEEDQWKAAFITPLGLFEPTVMFFGFCNAPSTFQAFMNHIFADMLAERWLKIYMDDLGLHINRTLKLHHEWMHRVLQWLREHSLSVKLSKCSFDTPTMEYLGLIIGNGQIRMDSTKLTTIDTWKPPTSVKRVCSFLGFANFYCKFIPNYSNIATPLTFLTQKDQHWIWSSLQQCAFDHLCKIFSSAPILTIPDTSHPFSLMTDASLLAAGAVLMQNDVNSDLHPCAYFSKTFSLTKQTTIFMTANCSWSSLLSLNGDTTSRELLLPYPSLPITKISHTSKTPINYLADKHIGPSSCKTSTLNELSLPALKWALLTPSLAKIPWIPPLTTTTPLLSQTLSFLMPST